MSYGIPWKSFFFIFLDKRIFTDGAVNPTPNLNPQTEELGLSIYESRRQGDPAISPGKG
jgi:hypothetical protein